MLDRAGVDARWAIVCTQLSHRLQAAGGADNPRFSAAVRRMERALYYDYELGDDFYPQFCQNIEILMPFFGQDAVKNSFVGSGLDRSVQLCGRNQRPGGVKTPPYKISRKLSDAGKRTVCRGDIHVSRVPFHRRQRPGRDKSLPYKTTTKAL